MPQKVIEYRCLLISPSDVKNERIEISKLIQRWNAQIGNALQTRVELVMWEAHAVPELGGEPQSIINKQIVDDCDFGIAIFWSRIGSKTEKHESGSIEEINRLLDKGLRVFVYFSKQPVPQDRLDAEQYSALQKYKSKLQKQGLLGEYRDIPNLKEQLQLHLTSVITNLIQKDKEFITDITPKTTIDLPKPKIIIKILNGFVQNYTYGLKDIIMIEVQNHSNFTVYLGTIRFVLKDSRVVFIKQDSATGEFQTRKELKPGQAFSFNVYPEHLLEEINIEDFDYVAISDDIDRIYKSDAGSLQKALQEYSTK